MSGGLRDFHRMSQPMRRRINGMVSRATISAVDDSKGVQALQIEGLADEAHDDVERMQDYGFSSHPLPGAEAVVVFVGGLRSHGHVTALADRRYRVKDLEPGEVAMYDDQGQTVIIRRDGIEIRTDKKVTINAAGELLIKSEAKVTVQAPEVLVESDSVSLGAAGGQPVARVGDSVVDGVITTGSDKVSAA